METVRISSKYWALPPPPPLWVSMRRQTPSHSPSRPNRPWLFPLTSRSEVVNSEKRVTGEQGKWWRRQTPPRDAAQGCQGLGSFLCFFSGYLMFLHRL